MGWALQEGAVSWSQKAAGGLRAEGTAWAEAQRRSRPGVPAEGRRSGVFLEVLGRKGWEGLSALSPRQVARPQGAGRGGAASTVAQPRRGPAGPGGAGSRGWAEGCWSVPVERPGWNQAGAEGRDGVGAGGALGRQVLCGALQDAPCTPGVCVKVPAWAVASSPHAELRDQPPCGGGTVPAPAGSPLAGGFLLEPSGLSTGLLPGPGEPEDTLFLLVFKAMGALAATPGSQPCGAHVGTLEPTAVRLGGRLGSLDLRVCACKWGCWCLAHGVLVRED